jgi:hypothetical protein
MISCLYKRLCFYLLLGLLAACTTVTLIDVNEGFWLVDRAWQLEYQRTEDEFRYRVIEADLPTTFYAVRRAFIDVGMPVQKESAEARTIICENVAPTPLTPEEWREVVRVEGPKANKIGKGLINLPENPRMYIVTIKATLKSFEDRTLVLLDYTLDSPEIRSRGLVPNRHAPPLAVKIGMDKIWKAVSERLKAMKINEPRRRRGQEFAI